MPTEVPENDLPLSASVVPENDLPEMGKPPAASKSEKPVETVAPTKAKTFSERFLPKPIVSAVGPVARGVLQGAASIPNLVLDPLVAVENVGIDLYNRASGKKIQPAQSYTDLSNAAINQLIPPPENVMGRAAEFLASAGAGGAGLPKVAGAFGNAPSLIKQGPAMLDSLVQNPQLRAVLQDIGGMSAKKAAIGGIAGATAGQASQFVASQVTDNPYVQEAANIVGGAVLPAVPGALRGISERSVLSKSEQFLGDSLPNIAKKAIVGKISTETSPETATAAASVLNKAGSKEGLANIGQSRVEQNAAQLKMAEHDQNSRLAFNQIVADANAAQKNADVLNKKAAEIENKIGPSRSAEQEGTVMRQLLAEKDQQFDKIRQAAWDKYQEKLNDVVKQKTSAGQVLDLSEEASQIKNLLKQIPAQYEGIFNTVMREISTTESAQPPRVIQGPRGSIKIGGRPQQTKNSVDFQQADKAYYTIKQYMKRPDLGHIGTQLDNIAQSMRMKMGDFSNGLYDEMRSQYEQDSKPINAFYEQDFVDQAMKMYEYRSRYGNPEKGTPAASESDYAKGPEVVADKFFKAQSRGADTAIKMLGPAQAESFFSSYMKREVEGKSGDQIRKMLSGNTPFFQRFPKLAQRLSETANAKDASENAMKEAADRAKVAGQFATPSDVAIGMQKAVLDGNVKDINMFRGLIKAQGGNPDEATRSLVASALFKDMAGIRGEGATANQIAGRINTARVRWNTAKKALLDSKTITAKHASDVDTVMNDLQSFEKGITSISGASEGMGLARDNTIATHIAVQAFNKAANILPWSLSDYLAKRTNDAVQEITQQILLNPKIAADYAKKVSVRKSDLARAAVAGVGGVAATKGNQ